MRKPRDSKGVIAKVEEVFKFSPNEDYRNQIIDRKLKNSLNETN